MQDTIVNRLSAQPVAYQK